MSGNISGAYVRRTAGNPKHGMTLDELGAFVQEALRKGIDGAEIVRIDATWKSSIKTATVSGNVPGTKVQG